MSKISILIIEDDPDIASDLEFSLEENGYIVTGIAANLQDAFGLFYAQNPDMVIADIMLGDKDDGITFVERINENPIRRKPVIFLTGMNDKATFEKAKKTGPFSYLLKPFNILELQYAIELSIEKLAGATMTFSSQSNSSISINESFFIKKGNNIIKIHYSDILYISVEHKYCDIFTSDNKYSIQLALKDLLDELPQHFIQVHRNYVTNLEYMEKYNIKDNLLYLKNNRHIPVSKRMKEKLMEHIKLLG